MRGIQLTKLIQENAMLKKHIAQLVETRTSQVKSREAQELIQLQRQRIDHLEQAYAKLYQRYENQLKSNTLLKTQVKELIARKDDEDERDRLVAREETRLYE